MQLQRGSLFIVNPKAGSRKAASMWPKMAIMAEKRLGPFQTRWTSKPGDAIFLAKEAVCKGVRLLVCVGGDGTLNEVINGLMYHEASVRENVTLGYIPCGTGLDLIRTIPIPKKPERAIAAIQKGKTYRIDIGKISFRNHMGKSTCRYFHNVVSFGLGGEVTRKINESEKWIGKLSFFRAAIMAVLKYGKKEIYIKVDNRLEGQAIIWNVVVGNGCFHGAGMKVAPKAKIDDGLFHISILGNMNIFEALCKFPKLYTGNLRAGKIHETAGRMIHAASDQNVLLDVDGECPGSLPAVIEIVPEAINLIVD
jgi:YegS/Rv2252/BmrU family lipid kinase